MGHNDSEMLLHLRMGLTKLGGNCAEVLILVLRSCRGDTFYSFQSFLRVTALGTRCCVVRNDVGGEDRWNGGD
jgi:hypothetical protein